MKNPYSVLGVENNAPLSVCKSAYKRLAKKYHPDNNGGDSVMFNNVKVAFEKIEAGFVVQSVTKQGHLHHKSMFSYSVI